MIIDEPYSGDRFSSNLFKLIGQGEYLMTDRLEDGERLAVDLNTGSIESFPGNLEVGELE
jgi:hypothetical protein